MGGTPQVLTFLGAAGTVTGSRFLVDHGSGRVLVDCGLFQGEREWRRRNWEHPGVDPSSVDVVVLTHAHLDHSGYLPALVRDGFDGPVRCTEQTAALVEILLRDAAHLAEEEAAHANAKGYSKHEPALPLFTEKDAERALRLLEPVPYGARTRLADGVDLTLRPAGHILGSAFALLDLDGTRLLVSGDLGRPGHPLLLPPPSPPPADVVLVEATYGDRRHGASDDELLAAAIRRTVGRGGTVLMPAFAVDRTFVLLMTLARLEQEGRIPVVPVHVDSPMALRSLEVYRRAVESGDATLRPEVVAGGASYHPRVLRLAQSREDSERLNRPDHPCIVVSASGMATGGRVLHHLAAQLPHPRNTVVLTGFQVPGTRGHSLLTGAPSLKIHGRYVPVRAEVVATEEYSAHADADQVVAWLATIPPPRTGFVVHGEPHAAQTLASRLRAELGWNVVVARYRERVRLD